MPNPLGKIFKRENNGQTVEETPATEAPAANTPVKPTGTTINAQKRAGIDVLTRLTQRSNQALMAGVSKAKELKLAQINSEHVLWGLLTDAGIYQLISELKVTPSELQKDLTAEFQPGNAKDNPQFSHKVKQILESSLSAARSLGYEFVSPEHILLAIAKEADETAAKILAKHGLTFAVLNRQIGGTAKPNKTKRAGALPALAQFTIDLTRLAREGKLDPVVARATEIERVMHVLSRRTKNNPVLIGEAGVGKTAIVEGLAQRIAAGNVPEPLKNKRILSVDLMSIIAGASHRGEFEERLRNLLREVKASHGEIIIFIDEIHNMVGTGGSGGNAFDAASILKPSLARGEILTIGATTITEYRKYMEKDRALERRFQPIMVEEPTPEQALEMLAALRDKYEKFHHVSIPDETLRAAVNLSHRYIGDRHLPDKAVDLIDEAASAVRLPAISLPEEIASLTKRKEILEKEKQAAQGDNDAVRAGAIDRQLEKVNKQLTEKQKSLELKQSTTTNVVSPAIIQDIVSRWTHIPLSKLTESESDKLLKLENLLHERIVDQQQAVDAVAEAVRRGRAGLKSTKRPIGSFIFMGPTGVGKTELAKALAEILFGSEEKIVRLDMTEYMEKHEVAKLIGAPPGYVGYEEGGQLTEAVRRQPYSVVLLDEVEKAHADVFNILLQILDDGRLTDNKGRTIDFKNTILVATSNIGTQLIQQELVTETPFAFRGATISTLVYSPTGRAILTLDKRLWQRDKAAAWETSSLADYFKGQKVEGAGSLTIKQQFPTAGFDAHVIAPSGEELIAAGGSLWRRKSTTAKTWETRSLIDYFKNQQVTNAAADRPEQQLPTAKIDTLAIPPSEAQIVTYKNRYWLRKSLSSNRWETGTLANYLQGNYVQAAAANTSHSQAAANNQQPVQAGGPAEPDEKLQQQMEQLVGSTAATPPQQNQQQTVLDNKPPPAAGKTANHPVPTDYWDIHLFTPRGEELVIRGTRFWRRAKFDAKTWSSGLLSELFAITEVSNADPGKPEQQFPIGQKAERARKEHTAEAKAKFARLQKQLLDELRKFFRPELLNRFDDILVFKPLSSDDLLKIVNLQLDDLAQLLEEQNIGLEVTAAAKQEIASEGFDPLFGARPLRRTIQKMIENPISSMIIKGELKPADIVNVDFDGADFIFTAKIHPSRAAAPPAVKAAEPAPPPAQTPPPADTAHPSAPPADAKATAEKTTTPSNKPLSPLQTPPPSSSPAPAPPTPPEQTAPPTAAAGGTPTKQTPQTPWS